MKKTLTVITMLAGAVSGYSQGLISFTDYSSTLAQQIFNTQATAPSGASAAIVTFNGYTVAEYQGDTAGANNNAIPSGGTAVYAAGTALSGTGFDAQLVAGPTAASMTAQGGILHFQTAATALGYTKGTSTVTLATGAVPTVVAIAAWVASGSDGAATTLAAAQADGYAWGLSTTASVTPNTSTASAMPIVEGFSLGTTVPEPSTIALGVMGASALLFRRKK